MDGSAILRHLAAADIDIAAAIPIDAEPPRLTCDILARGVQLPAMRFWKVSSVDHRPLSGGATRRVTQRIQAEIHARDVPQAKALLKLLRRACDRPYIAALLGLSKVSVLTDGEGPEGFSPATEGRVVTQDFRVSYNEVRNA